MVTLSAGDVAESLMLASEADAVKLLDKYAAEFSHQDDALCMPFLCTVHLVYVDHDGFEIPRPSWLAGQSRASDSLASRCPHALSDALRLVTA